MMCVYVLLLFASTDYWEEKTNRPEAKGQKPSSDCIRRVRSDEGAKVRLIDYTGLYWTGLCSLVTSNS